MRLKITAMTLIKQFADSAMKASRPPRMQCFLGCVSALFLLGCQTLEPSFNQTAEGNAWATTLPKGTRIEVSDPVVLAPAFLEIKEGIVIDPLVLVSREYLKQRDEREIEMIRIIEELKVRKDVP